MRSLATLRSVQSSSNAQKDSKTKFKKANNNGQGGLGGDAVTLNTQDGSGTNNANFATPVRTLRTFSVNVLTFYPERRTTRSNEDVPLGLCLA